MSVTEVGVGFNRLEREIFSSCCAAGREALKEQLEIWDGRLMAMRDRSVYRHKGLRKTVIKTVMGEVEYSRVLYERKNGDGTKSFVYLLDEAMGKSVSGYMSGLLSGQIAEAVCGGTYRRAAQSVSEMTGQTISHQAAWNVTQALGRRVDAHEKTAAALAAKNEGIGAHEAEEEGLHTLHAYFTNNKDGLVGYHRRGLKLPEPPEGKVYRRLGATESNIFTIIGNRMKGGRACWSIDGGNNLARLLTLKYTKRLHETLDSLTSWVLPAKYAEEVTVKMTPRQIPKQTGKGYEGCHAAAFPSTPEYKWLREMGKVKPEFSL